MNNKVRAARLSAITNSLLLIMKLSVGVAIGSVSVISEAVNSGTDVLAALLATFSLRVASQPADQEHRYGHGKVENLSALVEGVLILLAAAWILYEALRALLVGHQPTFALAGLIVMGISATTKWVLSRHLFRVAAAEESIVLKAEAINLRGDVWTSTGVFAGLLAVQVTGLGWLDPLMGLAVAIMIIRSGIGLCRQSLQPLVDARLPEEEEQEVVRLIEQHSSEFVEFHNLRTRQAGAERHVDFHLVVHGQRSLEEVHHLCDDIEKAIEDRFPTVSVLIHPEPCEPGCDLCQGSRLERRRMRIPARAGRTRGSVVRRHSTAPEFGL